jgi:hypothetical protein
MEIDLVLDKLTHFRVVRMQSGLDYKAMIVVFQWSERRCSNAQAYSTHRNVNKTIPSVNRKVVHLTVGVPTDRKHEGNYTIFMFFVEYGENEHCNQSAAG